jgi:hypothetical protein
VTITTAGAMSRFLESTDIVNWRDDELSVNLPDVELLPRPSSCQP